MSIKFVRAAAFAMAGARERLGRTAAEGVGNGAEGEAVSGLLSRYCCGRPGKYLLTAMFADSRCVGQGML